MNPVGASLWLQEVYWNIILRPKEKKKISQEENKGKKKHEIIKVYQSPIFNNFSNSCFEYQFGA